MKKLFRSKRSNTVNKSEVESHKTTTLKDFYEAGLNKPFNFVSEKEAVEDMAGLIGVFVAADSNSAERVVAITTAGQYMGCIKSPEIYNGFARLFNRICESKETQRLVLSDEEKRFCMMAATGRFYKPYW